MKNKILEGESPTLIHEMMVLDKFPHLNKI